MKKVLLVCICLSLLLTSCSKEEEEDKHKPVAIKYEVTCDNPSTKLSITYLDKSGNEYRISSITPWHYEFEILPDKKYLYLSANTQDDVQITCLIYKNNQIIAENESNRISSISTVIK
jgi:hypothetical protein